MKLRMLLSVLPLCWLGSEAAFARPPGRVVQRVVHSRGFVEPHTPGSGAPEEVAAAARTVASCLDSIATPAAWKEVHSVPGYTHIHVIDPADNQAVPLIADFMRRVRRIPPGLR